MALSASPLLDPRFGLRVGSQGSDLSDLLEQGSSSRSAPSALPSGARGPRHHNDWFTMDALGWSLAVGSGISSASLPADLA